MAAIARRRLIRDFKRLQSDPPHGVTGSPVADDIMNWQAFIFGPEGTPWEGGTFQLTLKFSDDYPNKPPKVEFVSKLFHPNVYADGNICLDILQNQWSPIYDISAILTSIQSLLCDPNPNSPANSEAAQLYSENRREYNRRIIKCVADSWKPVDSTKHISPTTSPVPPPPPPPPPTMSSSSSTAIMSSSSSSSTSAAASITTSSNLDANSANQNNYNNNHSSGDIDGGRINEAVVISPSETGSDLLNVDVNSNSSSSTSGKDEREDGNIRGNNSSSNGDKEENDEKDNGGIQHQEFGSDCAESGDIDGSREKLKSSVTNEV